MTEQTETTATTDYRWAVIGAITLAALTLLVAIGNPAIWQILPAFGALSLAIFASIRNPALRTPASVGAVIAAVAGGIAIFFG